MRDREGPDDQPVAMDSRSVFRPIVRTLRLPGIVLAAVGVVVPRPAAASVPTRTDNVIATDARGRVLADNPALQAGDHVVVTVSGFASRERVEVRSDRLSILEFAGSDGVVRVPLTITGSSAIGQHFVAVVERTPSLSDSSTTYKGSMVVAIPRIGVMPYRVVARSVTEPPQDGRTGRSDGPHATTDVPTSGGSTSLARTGRDLVVALLEGALAISAGAGVLRLNRRRRGTRQS